MREEIWSGFFDDSWKATPNLTIEYGVRYEAHSCLRGSLEGSGIVQGGVTPGVPNDVVFGNWLDFGPRLGIAYRLGNKTVIRTGAGVYYDSRTGQIAQQTFSNPPTFANVTVNCAVAGQSCNLTDHAACWPKLPVSGAPADFACLGVSTRCKPSGCLWL